MDNIKVGKNTDIRYIEGYRAGQRAEYERILKIITNLRQKRWHKWSPQKYEYYKCKKDILNKIKEVSDE